MSLPSRRLSVQNHPHDQQILAQNESRENSLCEINSRWRWRSAPTKSGWVPRLPRSWLLIDTHNDTERRNAAKQRGRYQRRQSKRKCLGSCDGKTLSFWSRFHTQGFPHKNERKSNHAPTRPQRRGQGRGIGQPAAEVCAVGGR